MIISTLLVKDDDDILDDSMQFHLNNGVDFFVVTAHNSNDNVREILHKHRNNILKLFVETDDTYNQSIWVTRMASYVSTEHRPDWIIHSDADEMWYNLKQLYEIRDKQFCITQCWHNYFPYSIDEFEASKAFTFEIPTVVSAFGEGMQNKKKVIHKSIDNIKILQGNHGIDGVDMLHQTGVIIKHYPVRTYKQFENKAISGGLAYEKYPNKSHGKQWRRWYQEYLNGSLIDTYMSFMNRKCEFV